MKGLFISFEGCDGSGKSTVSKAVVKKLQAENYQVIYTREPGGSDIAEQIRDIILNTNNTKMDAKTEALLYAASRRQHLVEKILPALNANKIVICDRFIDSSLAYQGVARNLGIDNVLNINLFATDYKFPDATIFLDVDEKIGLGRVKNRGNQDRLDQESLDFHTQVANGYQTIIKKFSNRMHLINADCDLDEVINNTYAKVKEIIYDSQYHQD